jgi:hypothetical protein
MIRFSENPGLLVIPNSDVRQFLACTLLLYSKRNIDDKFALLAATTINICFGEVSKLVNYFERTASDYRLFLLALTS